MEIIALKINITFVCDQKLMTVVLVRMYPVTNHINSALFFFL